MMSLLQHTTSVLALHIIGERASQKLAADIIHQAAPDMEEKYKVKIVPFISETSDK